MGENATHFRGVVRNGVIVLDAEAALPDGTEVRVTLASNNEAGPLPVPADMQAEFDQWQALGDEAWAMIDEWEKEDHGHEAG